MTWWDIDDWKEEQFQSGLRDGILENELRKYATNTKIESILYPDTNEREKILLPRKIFPPLYEEGFKIGSGGYLP